VSVVGVRRAPPPLYAIPAYGCRLGPAVVRRDCPVPIDQRSKYPGDHQLNGERFGRMEDRVPNTILTNCYPGGGVADLHWA
jgi:hypothetical protein